MKKDLISLLNEALKMEHAAAIQYYGHAELITGPMSDPLISRIRELAADEDKHAAKLRSLIGDFLLFPPTLETAPTRMAGALPDILKTNIETEREAIEIYRRILAEIDACKGDIPDAYETLRFDIDEILREEQEHVAELTRLI